MTDFLMRPEDAGLLRYQERPMPSRQALVLTGLILLVMYALCVVLTRSPVNAAEAMIGAVLFVAVLFGASMLDQHRVCEKALLLGATLPRATPYVVPAVTVDPASVRLHHRANFINRRLKQRIGAATMRMAPYSTVAVSFVGLHPSMAHPRKREDALLLATDFRFLHENAPPPPLVTARWVLATRHPEQLLEALEEMLINADVPGALGLADRQLRDPLVERWRLFPEDSGSGT